MGVRRLKRIFWALSALILLGVYLTACGTSGSQTTTNPTSGLTKRVLASNSFSGVINIIDASQDVFSTFSFQLTNAQPQQMELALDRSVTLVFSPAGNVMYVLNSSTEQQTGIVLPDHSDGFAALNNATGFASVRNANRVVVLDLQNSIIAQTVSVQTPVQVVLGHNGKKLLVFSDTLTDTITVIDTATASTNPAGAATAIQSALAFDHPISGVFSSDDSKAYILSCGAECGGAQANVTVVDMNTTSVVGSPIPVPGATVALLDSSTLYVAGIDGQLVGQLSVVDTGTMTVSNPVQIGDGFHWKMGLDTHSHLFIGARTCTQLRCLTIYDTGAKTATVEIDPDPSHNGNGFGDVGGIQAISGRDRMYLAQGGEIRIFNTTTAQPLPLSQQLDAVGKIEDVLQIDP